MIRQDIRIGDYTNKGADLVSYKYVVDFFKQGVDFKEVHKQKYVMIRKYNVINNIVYDTDIYLIERSILENGEDIVYPMTNGSFTGFTNDVSLFNDNYDNQHIKLGSDEVYEIYVKNTNGGMEIADIPCNILRVYHPHNKTELQSILYVDVLVNAVKFHILCKPYLSLASHSEEDFSIDGIRYSEYVECYIPDMEWMFNEKVYYREDLTIIDTPYIKETYPDNLISTETPIAIETDHYVHHKESYPIVNEPDTSYVNAEDTRHVNAEAYIGEIVDGFTILIEEAGREHRIYDDEELKKELILTPFNKLSPDGYEYAAFKLFTIPFYINEDNGVFSKNYVVDLNDSVAQDYVAYPIRVTIYPYDVIDESTGIYINKSNISQNSDVMQSDASMSLAAKIAFDDNGVPSLVCTFQFPDKDKFNNFREAYEYYYRVNLKDYSGIVEYDEEDEDEEDYVEQKQCAFILSLYTDYNMTSSIHTETFELPDPESQLDDFSFQLTNIFSSWDQLPDILIALAKFIDKWLGNVITSNPAVITDESFKYLVCDDPSGRNIVKWSGTEQTHRRIEDMDLSKINFIDKITCTIKRNVQEDDSAKKSSNTPKVLYKPVFYRVVDLQNITIRAGITQNIGVALAEYMTKVESFKMVIGGMEIVESARNDIYAIFPVNGSSIGVDTGTYHITNQDGELISSGQFTVIQ